MVSPFQAKGTDLWTSQILRLIIYRVDVTDYIQLEEKNGFCKLYFH